MSGFRMRDEWELMNRCYVVFIVHVNNTNIRWHRWSWLLSIRIEQIPDWLTRWSCGRQKWQWIEVCQNRNEIVRNDVGIFYDSILNWHGDRFPFGWKIRINRISRKMTFEIFLLIFFEMFMIGLNFASPAMQSEIFPRNFGIDRSFGRRRDPVRIGQTIFADVVFRMHIH